MEPGPLVVIVGETASGKSSLAIDLAEKFNGEIVCADAVTVRKGVDIGTAKPTLIEQSRARHHLLDIVEPCEDFTSAVFKRLAQDTIKSISDRGKVPFLVGGTGLYIDGVLFDYSFLPAGDRAARERLNKLSAEELLKLVEEQGIDTNGIDVRNKRRLVRLLETSGARGSRSAIRKNTLIIGIRTNREQLRQKIENRIEAMLASGLENEVKNLAEKYGWECEALKSIGYQEWQDYFFGSQDLEQTKNRIISSTIGLAKRQRTWFKRNESIHWLNNREEAEEAARVFLSNKSG